MYVLSCVGSHQESILAGATGGARQLTAGKQAAVAGADVSN